MEDLKKYLFKGEETKDINFIDASGIYLWDDNGNKYIDCSAGTFNLSLGYKNKDIIAAVKDQCDKMIHLSSSYYNETVCSLAKKLVEVSPSNIRRVHTKVCSGSTANEGAIKLAQYYTNKKDIISFYRSHVGQTIFLQNVSGLSVRRKHFSFSQDGIFHIPYPYCYRCHLNCHYPECGAKCADQIHDFILYASSGNIACIILEPILGNGGNQIAPKEFLKKVRKICDELNIVLIFDEIQTGIGRTGKMFAAQYFNVKPDIITVSKGLGGTGFPVSAILMEEKFNKMESFLHSFTYGSNILNCTAALKTLEIIDNNTFLKNVEKCGEYIINRLKKLQEQYDFIGDTRGVGLMIGIEIVKNKTNKEPDVALTHQIVKKAFDEKLLLRSSLYGFGNVIKIRPALNITLQECEEMIDKLEKVFSNIF